MKNQILEVPLERRIHLIRGHKVMLSSDLAVLYEVEPRALIQAVMRNRERFPPDFMFQLDDTELKILKSRIVISSWGGLRRAMPYAFTEQGVAMLSSVLRNKRAVLVNIAIMRAFVRLRGILASHKDLAKRLETLEKRLLGHDAKLGKHVEGIKIVLEAIYRLMQQPEPPPGKPKLVIGFRP